jgi:FO synthase
MKPFDKLLHNCPDRLSDSAALDLSESVDLDALRSLASVKRDEQFGPLISYSRKVFIPLTKLCQDVCHYCTFAHRPRRGENAYLTVAEAVEIARKGKSAGCKEALFTLGDKPERRYRAARDELKSLGFETTIAYLASVAKAVFEQTGLLPHVNPGLLSAEDLTVLRRVSVSQGIMLETAADRLSERGQPHFGSPDKVPARRLETLRLSGECAVPFTTGILIGIGETRRERIEALLKIRRLHERYGHIQEIIIQNFCPKPGTRMEAVASLQLNEHVWTIAMARLIFDASMNIQAPPNLSPDSLKELIAAGINDWGGVSPVTPDHVNPEAPWPHLAVLEAATAEAGKTLVERLALYPEYVRQMDRWADTVFHTPLHKLTDTDGRPRTDGWNAGSQEPPPADVTARITAAAPSVSRLGSLMGILQRSQKGIAPAASEIVSLFRAQRVELTAVCRAADELRADANGNTVSYVVTRNINYTNICYFKCQFCAFSKGKLSENLRGKPYNISLEEITTRVDEAWQRGATEVCMQGGIHPDYTGNTYLSICAAVKRAQPGIHVHAFSPLEIQQGAETLGISIAEFLTDLKAAGLGTLPGTAAEILDDEIRDILCHDKLRTYQWLDVMRQAHMLGIKSTSTIMFGHMERYEHWARHLLRLRDLQADTGGFTEFVPLPFVHMEAPIYLKGRSRQGPTFREAILMHAVARLVFNPLIRNIQASWVKLGDHGVRVCLQAGVNDLGGTLMNETISRAAGAAHGQEMTPELMEAVISGAGRIPFQRVTTYGPAPDERRSASFAAPLLPPVRNMLVSARESDLVTTH